MHRYRVFLVTIALFCGLRAWAQLSNQIQLKVDPNNRTLTVSAEGRVTAEPEIAILHIGFLTPPSDAKQAYAAGAKASNQIIDAIKQAGIAETAIRSESQQLESSDSKSHKFRLQQSWVVKVPPARVAEILDIAVSAGATDSGQVEWTVNDEKALENQALEQASARAQNNAQVLAKGMGVRLGSLVYVTNQIAGSEAPYGYANRNFSAFNSLSSGVLSAGPPPPPLMIEPHKVSRLASVYAVYAIE